MAACGWCDVHPPGARPSCDRCRLGCDHSLCGTTTTNDEGDED